MGRLAGSLRRTIRGEAPIVALVVGVVARQQPAIPRSRGSPLSEGGLAVPSIPSYPTLRPVSSPWRRVAELSVGTWWFYRGRTQQNELYLPRKLWRVSIAAITDVVREARTPSECGWRECLCEQPESRSARLVRLSRVHNPPRWNAVIRGRGHPCHAPLCWTARG